jgi:hypothetical protein
MQSNICNLQYVKEQLEEITYEISFFDFEDNCRQDDKIKIHNYKQSLFQKEKRFRKLNNIIESNNKYIDILGSVKIVECQKEREFFSTMEECLDGPMTILEKNKLVESFTSQITQAKFDIKKESEDLHQFIDAFKNEIFRQGY